MHPADERRAIGNRFVDALPADVADAIFRVGEFRVVPDGERVLERGEPIEVVLFPVSGAFAQVERQAGGREVEIGFTGSNGVAAFEALLDHPRALFTNVAAVPASALAVQVPALRRIHDASAPFARLMRRYAAASIRLAAISAACGRHHRLTARLARWLLQMHDHAGRAGLAITHERAARMLAAHRPGITRAAAAIAATGAIRWDRARLELVDPSRLAGLTCDCRAEAAAVVHELYAEEPFGRPAFSERESPVPDARRAAG